MDYYSKYNQYSNAKFLRLTGLSKDKFQELIPIFLEYVNKNWNKRGRPGGFKVSLVLVDILKLPNLQSLDNTQVEGVIIDVSKQRTERPKKTKNQILW